MAALAPYPGRPDPSGEPDLTTALGTAAALRAGATTATAVVEATLRRIADVGPRVGAFVHVATEQAMQAAAAADRRLSEVPNRADRERVLPPLLGVPCPVKDLNPVAGMPYVAGSRALLGNVADVDDGVVHRLRDAGAIVVGKTTTPEFGFPCYTEPDGRPPTVTPWDPSRSAGGSSGGAAAAVASGIVPIAQASDGGGSIRIPASACGLVGLKP
ncbi:MAG: amidase, partial [Austwickia sp.]|nr:amidase [Austwickia sp.]